MSKVIEVHQKIFQRKTGEYCIPTKTHFLLFKTDELYVFECGHKNNFNNERYKTIKEQEMEFDDIVITEEYCKSCIIRYYKDEND